MLVLDLELDRPSFETLGEDAQNGMLWIFAHRLHPEFNVARLPAPFLLATRAAATISRTTCAVTFREGR